MLIQGAFMHVNDSLTSGQFLKFLAGAAPVGRYFVAQPPPGIIMTAAIDWRVIIPDTDAADALATALWSGYESLVKPQGKGENGNSALIFIQIKNVKGECDQFTMGKDVDKKDGFMNRVKESIAVLSSKNKDAALLQVMQEIERTSTSDYWAQIV
jgi:hypothetical protein